MRIEKEEKREKNTEIFEKERKESNCYDNVMPLLQMSFCPGECLDFIKKMKEGSAKGIALAEYYYFSGQAEKAVKAVKKYLMSEQEGIRLSACLIYAYANLFLGQTVQTRWALAEIKNDLTVSDGKLVGAKFFIASAAAVLLHLPMPKELPDLRESLEELPVGLRAFAMYVQSHYLYLQKEYAKSLGIVEATLVMMTKEYPIPEIYLHLAAVMDCVNLRQPDQARKHLLAAWKLAKPDDLIEGFGEHHGLLGGMLEAVIKKEWPGDFKRIIAITYQFSDGWRKIHNPATGNDVADNLTTTEFSVAMLAARGWTNQEIGRHMNISPNTVKHYISVILQKLHINHRQELKRYMLQ